MNKLEIADLEALRARINAHVGTPSHATRSAMYEALANIEHKALAAIQSQPDAADVLAALTPPAQGSIDADGLPKVPRTYQQTAKEYVAIQQYGQACILADRAARQSAAPGEEEICALRLCCRDDAHAQDCTTYDPRRKTDHDVEAPPAPSEPVPQGVPDAISYKLKPGEKIFYSSLGQSCDGLPFMTDSSQHSTWDIALVFDGNSRLVKHVFVDSALAPAAPTATSGGEAVFVVDEDDERVRFEEWAGNPPVEIEDIEKDPDSFWCWLAWQAALGMSPSVRGPALILAPPPLPATDAASVGEFVETWPTPGCEGPIQKARNLALEEALHVCGDVSDEADREHDAAEGAGARRCVTAIRALISKETGNGN